MSFEESGDPVRVDAAARRALAHRLYPATIIVTRYGGVYEGGMFAAFGCEADEVPDAAVGSDVECAEFWASAAVARVGRGNSPSAAWEDLLSRLLAAGCDE